MAAKQNGSKTRINRPFVGIPSFLRAPICLDPDDFDGAIAVMGVPFDEGSPFLSGSRLGPRALREHSLRFVSGSGGFYNPETRKSYLDVELTQNLIVDIGDADVAPTNVERTFAEITAMVRAVLDRGALPVVLGGDHSITYPIWALREHSLRFVSGSGGFYNPETRKSYLDVELTQNLIVDIGDADVAPTNVERTFAEITAMVRAVLDRGALPVVLGGDHSITY